MSRIVQDSDDESASEAEVEEGPMQNGQREDEASRETAKTHRSGVHTEQAEISGGTSSSEKLRQDLQKAHTALVEPTPSGKRRAQDDFDVPSSISQKQSKPKRAKTTDASSSSRGVVRTLSNRKTSKGSGTKSTAGFDWDIPNSQDDEDTASKRDQHESDLAVGTTAASEGTVTQDDLYPTNNVTEPSPINKVTEPMIGHVEHSPHDTVMDTSSSSRAAAIGRSRPTQLDLSFQNHEPNELFPNSANIDGSSAASLYPQGTVFARGTKEQAQSPRGGPPQSPITPSVNDADELQLPANGYFQKRTNEQEQSISTARHLSNAGKVSAKEFSSQISTSDELAAEGLPKEMYIPRPSRSRGALGTREATTAPTATANKSKARPKRRKTTGFTLSSPRSMLVEMGFSASDADRALLETDNNVQEAAALLAGGDASQTSKSARKSKLLTVEEEDEDDEPDRPADLSKTGKNSEVTNEADATGTANNRRKRAPTKAQSMLSVEEEDASASQGGVASKPNKTVDDSDDEEEVVQPNSRRRRRLDHASLDELDEPPPEENGTAHAAKVAELAVETRDAQADNSKAKRGRGRPKKSDVTIDEEDDEPVQPAGTAEEAGEESQREEAQSAKKGRGWPKKPTEAPESATKEKEIVEPVNVDECTPVHISQHDKAVLQETSVNKLNDANRDPISVARTPTKESEKTTVYTSPQKRHSPLNNGRVPIKVGLSRRMRVEPLLRIIRK